MPPNATVLLTDIAWTDAEIERGIIESAGLSLVRAATRNADEVADLAQQNQPAAILTCWAPVNRVAIERSPCLQHVGRMGIGIDNIDVAACSERGIWVTNVPDYCLDEVSDHAIALLLAWARGVVALDRQVRGGRWDPAGVTLKRLRSLTVGLIGYGSIGRLTAEKLKGFGCRIVAHTHRMRDHAGDIADFMELEKLLRISDVVILHLPLTPGTRHLMNEERIGQMRRGSLLINVSRGPIVDTQALAVALQENRIDAALDVIDGEPCIPTALTAHETSIFTPHIAFNSHTSISELRRRAACEVVRVLSGEVPEHPCNSPNRGLTQV